jgi:hypothetical protein
MHDYLLPRKRPTHVEQYVKYAAHNIETKTLKDTFLTLFSCLPFLFYNIVIVNISVEIKLSNKTFNEELKNESSPAYIELKNDVYVEVL